MILGEASCLRVGSVPRMPHPDVERERARLKYFRECLSAMAVRTASFIANDSMLAANEADAKAVQHQLALRLKTFDIDGVLCFGTITETPIGRNPSTVWPVGKRNIDDEAGAPIVVDWRAPVAIPFYRATAVDPLGLDRRRRFTFAGRELADIYEEDFTDPDSMLDGAAHGVPDPLLAELRRERSGQMRDIVATIQAEQDIVIRAGLEECLIVQGGPGTGKTAVGLHRAAFLLYEHRELLGRLGVLVVGPNRVFLEYISQVLPSLGETSVTQSTVDGLFGLRFRCTLTDPVERARLLGDPRWVEVIRVAAARAINPPSDAIALRYRSRVMRIEPVIIASLIDAAQRSDMSLRQQRERFRARVLRAAHDQWSGGELQTLPIDEFSTEVLAHNASRSALDKCWMPQTALALTRSLLMSKAALARAATGIFDPDEQQVLIRKKATSGSAELWSTAELPIFDEIDALLNGDARKYGHVVVDEAQDLSPMALRVISRRTTRGSMTILGDLAQATGAHASTSWETALDHLGRPDSARHAELTVGYRLPASILEFANQLLAEAAPHVTPASSARDEGEPPEVLMVTTEDRFEHAGRVARELGEQFMTVAVVAPVDLHEPLRSAGLVDAAMGEGITLVDAANVKGLEFDAVVVVEPTMIYEDPIHGPRLLYVALTRAVHRLVLVTSQPLPDALARTA